MCIRDRLRQEEGLIPQLLKQMGITVESLDAAVMAEVRKLPQVTSSGREADKYYICLLYTSRCV